MARPLSGTLGSTYDALAGVVARLGEERARVATGCPGWEARHLVSHLRADCIRALVAVHTPALGPADCDEVDYWRRWGSDPDTDESIRQGTRTEAEPYSWSALRARYLEAASAAVRAVTHADPSAVVATQGHAIRLVDLTSTLVVEATLHHLDLVRHLPDAPGPADDGLTETRRVAEALLGRSLPGWPDARVASVATGRADPTAQERSDLGGAVIPVFT